MLTKPIAMITVALAALILFSPAIRAQMLPMPGNTSPEFRAVAQAQLETIHYQAHVFLEQRGRYPESLQELRDSGYWVVEVYNIFTALPIQQVRFFVHDEDYAVNDALPQVGLFVPLPDEEGAEFQDAQGQAQAQMGRKGGKPGRRVDPARVEFPPPGDLFYNIDADSLQLVIFDDTGAWEELWVELPFNYRASSLKLTEAVRPRTDLMAAEVAMHLENILPGQYNRMLFLTDRQTFAPTELAKLLPVSFEKMAAELSLGYINGAKQRAFMRTDYYSPGDLAIAPWLGGEESLIYFLEGKRARTLLELTDADVFRENAALIKRRDKLVVKHADDPPPAPGN